MNEGLRIEDLLLNSGDGVELLPTLFAFLICLIMAFVLRAFYQQRSFSLTGKTHIGSIIPILSAVVFIVIVVVKSSLALSLGLVGALSIVRFRTPIKEPEELVYLFLSIAIGLGYGAGHVLITSVLVTLTLFVIYFWLSNTGRTETNEYNVIINWTDGNVPLSSILEIVNQYADSVNLIRIDAGGNKNMAILLIAPGKEFQFDAILESVKSLDSNSTITFYESNTHW